MYAEFNIYLDCRIRNHKIYYYRIPPPFFSLLEHIFQKLGKEEKYTKITRPDTIFEDWNKTGKQNIFFLQKEKKNVLLTEPATFIYI